MVVSIGTMQQGFVGDWAIVPPMKEEKKEKEKINKEFLITNVLILKFYHKQCMCSIFHSLH